MEKWSKELEEQTRESIFSGAMVKSRNYEYGFCFFDAGIVTIRNVITKDYMPLPGEKTIARFDTIEQMIEAGWVID
ncbi:MAG: hypothetical protein P1P63_02955 [Treponemataceae bacterium]